MTAWADAICARDLERDLTEDDYEPPPDPFEEDMMDDIPRTPITSKLLAGIGYHPESQTLAVQFTSGAIYRYEGVDQAAHDALMAADSKGAHFLKTIKNGGYKCTRVDQ